jgi:CheY-like chemotaxis protein
MQLTGARLLVVEDEALLAMSMQDLLETCGCQVVAMAMNLTRAIEHARTLPLDAAVLDVNLGGERIDQVADILSRRGVPFIFATGYDDALIVAKHPGRPRIGKPYVLRELREKLTEVLGTSTPPVTEPPDRL